MRLNQLPGNLSFPLHRGRPWRQNRYGVIPCYVDRVLELPQSTQECTGNSPAAVSRAASVHIAPEADPDCETTRSFPQKRQFASGTPVVNNIGCALPDTIYSNGLRKTIVAFLLLLSSLSLLAYMYSAFSTKLRIVESEIERRNLLGDKSISLHAIFHQALQIPKNSKGAVRKTESYALRERTQENSPVTTWTLKTIMETQPTLRSIGTILASLLGTNQSTAASAVNVFENVDASWRNHNPTNGANGIRSPQRQRSGFNAFRGGHQRNDLTSNSFFGAPGNKLFNKNVQPTQEAEAKMDKSFQAQQTLPEGRRIESPYSGSASTAGSGLILETKQTFQRENMLQSPKKSSKISESVRGLAPRNCSSVLIGKQPESRTLRKSQNRGQRLLDRTSRQSRESLGGLRLPKKFPEKVELWQLQPGISLCRIYNVGRLSDGILLLPSWMQKHSLLLNDRCGLKNVLYVMAPPGSRHKFVFNAQKQNRSLTRKPVIDRQDRDLLSSVAPRHHMPHFVSDILMPMTAAKVLRGSNVMPYVQESLEPQSSRNTPVPSSTMFGDLKPCLFLRSETWYAKPSSWVWKLASFFTHPAIGCELLKEHASPNIGQTTNAEDKNSVHTFRSVLSSNMKQNEAQGLSGENGNNYVLSENGLAVSPAWKMKGIYADPCRVLVTALTRSGPRSLLNLDRLNRTANLMFRASGLDVSFKVVKFEESSFQQQVETMQNTNVLIAAHGAGNANLIFMRRGAAVIEVFPFAYKAGPFDQFARTFGIEYETAMSAPQTKVFKDCLIRHESRADVRQKVLWWWDRALEDERRLPWIHRLELEKEFGEPGKSEGMATRRCVRMQQLEFNQKTVISMALSSARRQCESARREGRPPHMQ